MLTHLPQLQSSLRLPVLGLCVVHSMDFAKAAQLHPAQLTYIIVDLVGAIASVLSLFAERSDLFVLNICLVKDNRNV